MNNEEQKKDPALEKDVRTLERKEEEKLKQERDE